MNRFAQRSSAGASQNAMGSGGARKRARIFSGSPVDVRREIVNARFGGRSVSGFRPWLSPIRIGAERHCRAQRRPGTRRFDCEIPAKLFHSFAYACQPHARSCARAMEAIHHCRRNSAPKVLDFKNGTVRKSLEVHFNVRARGVTMRVGKTFL